MKHNRKNKKKCRDWSHENFVKRFRIGLGADYDGGHQGSARDIKEAKNLERRSKRHRANDQVRRELDD